MTTNGGSCQDRSFGLPSTSPAAVRHFSPLRCDIFALEADSHFRASLQDTAHVTLTWWLCREQREARPKCNISLRVVTRGHRPENRRTDLCGDAFFIQLAKQGINFGSWNWPAEEVTLDLAAAFGAQDVELIAVFNSLRCRLHT